MQNIAPTTWRTGSFAGLFGDAHLADTELEGGSTRGAIGAVASWIRAVAEDSALLLGPTAFSSIERTHLQTLADKLGAAETVAGLSDDRTRAGLEVAVRASLGLVENLKARGDYALLPGGWATPDGGHAVMYAVVREADAPDALSGDGCPPSVAVRRFTFVVLNSGQGLHYHALTHAGADGQPKLRYRTPLALGGVPGWRLLDPSFMYMLLRLRAAAPASNGPPVLYEALLMHLAGDDPVAAARDAAATGREGAWETPQRAGFCFVRCVLTAVRYVTARVLGWPARSVKLTMLAQRLAVLRQASAELRAGAPATPSDLGFLLLAAQQSSRALGKAGLRKHVSEAEFAAGNLCVRALLAQLRGIATAAGIIVAGLPPAPLSSVGGLVALPARGDHLPPLLGMRVADDVLVTGASLWPGLDLAAATGHAGVAHWLGDKQSPGRGTDLSALTLALPADVPRTRIAPGWTWAAYNRAVASVLAACEALMPPARTGAAAVAYGDARILLTVALIEWAVLEVLPPPLSPRPSPAAAAASRGWNVAPVGVTEAAQLELLRRLHALLCSYLAAVYSCDARDGGGALQVVTLCAVVAALDAVARVTPAAQSGAAASPEPPPLSRALRTAPQGCPIPTGLLADVVARLALPSFGALETRDRVLQYANAVNAAAAASAAPTPLVAPGKASFGASFLGGSTLGLVPGSEATGLRFVADFLRAVQPASLEPGAPLPSELRKTFAAARDEAVTKLAPSMGGTEAAGRALPPAPTCAGEVSEFFLVAGWYVEPAASGADDGGGRAALCAYRDALLSFNFGCVAGGWARRSLYTLHSLVAAPSGSTRHAGHARPGAPASRRTSPPSRISCA